MNNTIDEQKETMFICRASHVYSVQLMFLWMVLEDHKVLCVIKLMDGDHQKQTNVYWL